MSAVPAIAILRPLQGRQEGAGWQRQVNCRDVGVDCDFVARGETEQEVLQQCAEHARTAHGMNEIPPELEMKVRAAIRDQAA